MKNERPESAVAQGSLPHCVTSRFFDPISFAAFCFAKA
jgi:hypothetical protein